MPRGFSERIIWNIRQEREMVDRAEGIAYIQKLRESLKKEKAKMKVLWKETKIGFEMVILEPKDFEEAEKLGYQE